jgi:hypothetical protein
VTEQPQPTRLSVLLTRAILDASLPLPALLTTEVAGPIIAINSQVSFGPDETVRLDDLKSDRTQLRTVVWLPPSVVEQESNPSSEAFTAFVDQSLRAIAVSSNFQGDGVWRHVFYLTEHGQVPDIEAMSTSRHPIRSVTLVYDEATLVTVVREKILALHAQFGRQE